MTNLGINHATLRIVLTNVQKSSEIKIYSIVIRSVNIQG